MASNMHGNSTTQKLRLEVHATKLKNASRGRSCPYAVLTLQGDDPREKPQIVGRTETIDHSLCPQWTKSLDIGYEFGKTARITVNVFDSVNNGNDKPMGSATFDLSQVLATAGNTKAKRISRGGTLFLRVTPAPHQSSGTLHLQLRGDSIDNVNSMFGKPSPFFEISTKVKAAGSIVWQTVYRSSHVVKDTNPAWKACAIDLDRLVGEGNDLNSPILVSVLDWQRKGRHHIAGTFETSVEGLISSKSWFGLNRRGKKLTGKVRVVFAEMQDLLEVAPPADTGSARRHEFAGRFEEPVIRSSSVPTNVGGYSHPQESLSMPSLSATRNTQAPPPTAPNSGAMSLPLPPPLEPTETMMARASAPPSRPSFFEYVTGGCELHLQVAIDFTGSNGDPRVPGSLHHMPHNGQLNDYEQAITTVGSVVAQYNSEQMFPVYGFGAKYGGVLQNCFEVGGAMALPGISGVLEGYRSVFQSDLTMSGPTVFAEVINMAAATARSREADSEQHYTVLLIVTDGAVSDIDLTKRSLEAASDAPLSIVIVGVGRADFRAMQFLDSFQSTGPDGRHTCQFVEFNRYRNRLEALAQQTLEKIPEQVVDYFYNRGIQPVQTEIGSTTSSVASDADEEEQMTVIVGPDGELMTCDRRNRRANGSTNSNGSRRSSASSDRTAPRSHNPPSTPAESPSPGGPRRPHPRQYSSPPSSPARPSSNYTHNRRASDSPYTHSPGAQQPRYSPSYSPVSPSKYQQDQYASPVANPAQIFQVIVPQGVGPGMQVQVQNPVTNQQMVVTVPAGVYPGSVFTVSY